MKAANLPVCQWLQKYVFAPATLSRSSANTITRALNAILLEVSHLYLKTTDLHLQMRGARFRNYHLLLDKHADQLYAMTDRIAERVRTLGGAIMKPFNFPNRRQRVLRGQGAFVHAAEALAELSEHNQVLIDRLRKAKAVCKAQADIATTSMIEVWIDETKRRSLFEADGGC